MTRIKTFIVILQSVLQTLYSILTSVLLYATGRLTRAHSNRLILQWSRALLQFAGIRRTITMPNPPIQITKNRRYMIMCNHSSLYDIPLSYDTFSELSIRMLAKRELSHLPLFGFALRINEFLFVDRKNKDNALRDLQSAKLKMQQGITLWVAPEGTRSSEGQLLPFKKGVFHLAQDSEAVIIPLYIKDAHKVLAAKSFDLQLNQEVSIRIGEPIDSLLYPGQKRKQLMAAVRNSFLQLAHQ